MTFSPPGEQYTSAIVQMAVHLQGCWCQSPPTYPDLAVSSLPVCFTLGFSVPRMWQVLNIQ